MLQAGHEDELRRTLKDLQVVDVLQRHPARGTPDVREGAASAGAAPVFDRLEPRSRSATRRTSRSRVVDYELDGQRRLGAASAFLASLEGDEARGRVFIEQNERFRLPADTSRDVIMIGPGTGVAPFRGFVQHREAQGATGRNWLFFGARHFASEFLYQVEWQDSSRRAC